LDHLKAAAERVATAFSGDAGIAGAVEKLSKVINEVADNAEKTLHPRDFEPGGSKVHRPREPGRSG